MVSWEGGTRIASRTEVIFEMFNVFDSANQYTTMTNYKYDAANIGALDRASLTPRQYQLGIKYRF